MILGLTGGYCAGKNELARILEARGFVCIDLDRLGHAALERVAARVAELLGPGVLDADGKPIRRAIGARVFSNPELLARYEAIVHPEMLALLDGAIEDALARGRDVCVNAAILYKIPQAGRCQAIVELRAPLFLRLIRAHRRDGLKLAYIFARIRAQADLLARRVMFRDRLHILRNAGGPADLERAADRLLAEIRRGALDAPEARQGEDARLS